MHQSAFSAPIPAKPKVRARFSFQAGANDELSFMAGEEFALLSKTGHGVGWWRGMHNGKEGLFPSQYVAEL